MNAQREIIYNQRGKVLDGEDISDYIKKMIQDYVSSTVCQYILDSQIQDEWNLTGLRDHMMGFITTEEDLNYTLDELGQLTRDDIINILTQKALDIYAKREEELTTPVIREIERIVLLKVVDTKWMAHIDDMDELKRGIGLRAYGQKNPVVEYRIEGFDMFDAMIASICEDTIHLLFTVQVKVNEEPPQREQVLKADQPIRTDGSLSNTRTVKNKPGRNDLCPCGSGKKYKKCCGVNE